MLLRYLDALEEDLLFKTEQASEQEQNLEKKKQSI
jgi:hypothetical protein